MTARDLAAAVLGAALAACSATLPEGTFPCDQRNDCPDSWICFAGSCYSSTPAAGAGGGDRPVGDVAAGDANAGGDLQGGDLHRGDSARGDLDPGDLARGDPRTGDVKLGDTAISADTDTTCDTNDLPPVGAIFVSASQGSDTIGTGTAVFPVASISNAFSRIVVRPVHIIVDDGM